MATTALDPNLEESQDQASHVHKNILARLSSAGVFRMILFAVPIFLWTAAMLSGLVFFATQKPVFGTVSLGFALAAGAVSLLVAVSMRDS